ncbi:MAG: response regulator [Calditrichaeota bacterium]|jgi:two-component system, cell cycle sensor histidine kinase and response regulator CckA|nr:response regulator [Calditrichota bacterium]MBT7619221.1 response regulator [Calditrichota bacterium]MBT7789725.1 response regulator [Calditrichota bacterium]
MTTILVVDDEKSVLDTTKTLLEYSGYGVLIADNGIEAIDLFKEKNTDIGAVILDMGMPEMSGVEVLQHLVKIDSDVNVIITSGDIDESDQKIVKLGAKCALQKPFKLKELLNCIEELTESS